jgi:hypothetical protein|tara:strand:- start:68 stop:235 length:168 start_codon:yes stop_codon:yes gene_type:complete
MEGSQLTASGTVVVSFKELGETPPKKSLNVRFCPVLRCWQTSIFNNIYQHASGGM